MESTIALADATALPSANGKGPIMPRHERWIDLAEYDYPTFFVKIWANPPKRIDLDLSSEDDQRVNAAWAQVFLAVQTRTEEKVYDRWFDCDGDPLPIPGEKGFLDGGLPSELLATTLRATRMAWMTVPNFLPRRKERSADG